MKFLPLVWSNLKRKKARTVFTFLTVVVAFILYGGLMALRQSFSGEVKVQGADMLVMFGQQHNPMPLAYDAKVAALHGVLRTLPLNAVLVQYQSPKNTLFVTSAPPQSYFAMLSYLTIPPAQLRHWLQDRTGAVVRQRVAKRFHWKVGDHIPLIAAAKAQRPGGDTLHFTVDGIWTEPDDALNVGDGIIVHPDYLHAWSGTNTIDYELIQVRDQRDGSAIADTVDAMFANSAAPTKTVVVKGMVQNLLMRFGAVGTIAAAVIVIGFLSMLLVTASSLTQAVRERLAEFAALKALGFTPRALVALVLAEAALLVGVGGLLGLGIACATTAVFGDQLSMMGDFAITPAAIVLGAVLAAVMAAATAALPIARVSGLRTADSLRRA
jgi:putative ABC transport system permease protein